jgi:hypothetical protein
MARMPDGMFSNQKSILGQILESLAMVGVGIFYGHLVHFTVFWYILWTFGPFYGLLVYFFDIWYILRQFGIFFHVLVLIPKKS